MKYSVRILCCSSFSVFALVLSHSVHPYFNRTQIKEQKKEKTTKDSCAARDDHLLYFLHLIYVGCTMKCYECCGHQPQSTFYAQFKSPRNYDLKKWNLDLNRVHSKFMIQFKFVCSFHSVAFTLFILILLCVCVLLALKPNDSTQQIIHHSKSIVYILVLFCLANDMLYAMFCTVLNLIHI